MSDKKLNLLVVCQYYYPENFQINEICSSLVERGHKVTVLTGLPNYPTGIIEKEYKWGRKSREIINGVEVIRSFEIGRRKGIVGLALNYMSYFLSASHVVKKMKTRFDLVFVYQLSPVLMGLPGSLYKKRFAVPLLLYCCDLWPESMKLMIKNEKSALYKAMTFVSRKVYQSAEKILVQTTHFLPYFHDMYGISGDRIKYLPQFANEDYLKEDFQLDNGIVDFVFLGNIGIAQEVDKIIDAVNKLKEVKDFRVHIVGDGSCLEKIKQQVIQSNLQNIVCFYGRRPVEEMSHYYELADVCLVSLSSDNLTGLTLPSKVQGYMAAGKMIIGMINGATKEVLESSGCGICVPSGDSEALAQAMLSVINNSEAFKECGLNGRKYFKEHFAKEKFMDALENTMKEMVK